MRELDATPSWLTITYLVPFSVWWLTQLSMLAEPPSRPLGSISLQVLQALLATQMLGLCLFAPHWRAVSVAAAMLPAWPVLAILGFAAGVSISALAATEATIAIAGLIVMALTALVRKLFSVEEMQRLAITSLGFAAAILAWLSRALWLQWVGQ